MMLTNNIAMLTYEQNSMNANTFTFHLKTDLCVKIFIELPLQILENYFIEYFIMHQHLLDVQFEKIIPIFYKNLKQNLFGL